MIRYQRLLSFIVFFSLLTFTLQAQWQRQYPLDKLEQVLDISVHHDGHGYAVGSADLLLKLDPGTKTWDLINGWDKNWRLQSTDYLENQDGQIAVAGGSGLIRTDNGGTNWTQVMGAPQGITAIKMFAADTILMIGSTGVFRLENKTWVNRNLPVNTGVGGGFILDRQHIWCFTVGGSPKMYLTVDGGAHWNLNTDIPSPDLIVFYNTQYGISTDGRKVFSSIDGGAHWTERSNNAIPNTSADMAFGESPNVLIAAMINANPAISVDSGLTWKNAPTGLIDQRSFSVAATSDLDFWLGNDISSIAHTSSAGNSWVESCGPARTIIQDVHFINRTDGWAVGLKGYVLRTNDGGTSWQDITSAETRNFLSIDGLAANDLWVGANQRIFHSSDAGMTWQEKAALTGGNINDILPINSNRILAVSSAGIVYRTTNAGVKWDTVYNAGTQMRSLAHVSGNRYLATGFNGIILRSDDSGDTWTPIQAPEAGLQYEQSVFKGTDGWLVTSSFKSKMWHTTNGGDSWDTITLPIDRFWDGVYFITRDTGIVVCHSTGEGRAYITYNGGMNWQSSYVLPYTLSGVSGVPNPNGTAWIFGFGSDIEVLPYCNTLPSIADFTGNLAPCQGDTITYSVSSLNVEQFHWIFPPGWKYVGPSDNDTVRVIPNTTSGNISVTGTNICGFSGQLNFPVSAHPLPVISDLQGEEAPCIGSDVTYTVQAENQDAVFWSFPPGWHPFGDVDGTTVMVEPNETPGVVTAYCVNQCGTSETVSLPVTPYIPPVATLEGIDNGAFVVLSPQVPVTSYQWYLNGTPIPGATDAFLDLPASGVYTVVIFFANGCTTISAPYDFTVGTHSPESTLSLTLFPSPASDQLVVQGLATGVPVEIVDGLGRCMLRETYNGQSITIRTLPSGIYLLRATQHNQLMTGRFEVLTD